jgi:hypothetical protein
MTRKCRQIAKILKDKAYARAYFLSNLALCARIAYGLWQLCYKIETALPSIPFIKRINSSEARLRGHEIKPEWPAESGR